MSLNQITISSLKPINIVYSQWDFRAFREGQLTVVQGETLLLLSESPNDDWATVRKLSKPGANTPSSGLVPKSYLTPKAQAFRGYALYTYKPDNVECVRMFIGRKVSVYKTLGEWVLVKIDASGRGAESIGYVPKSYVKRFEDTNDCRECAYFRQALFAHQGVNGQNHLFDIRRTTFTCDGCRVQLNGTDFFYCMACRHDKGNGYDLVSLFGRDTPVLP
ncbi:cytoskeletal protein binding protein [Tulasnella sp. 408]|nr:cytoskeletal protein binding protein [Tulasnella sp. 408]